MRGSGQNPGSRHDLWCPSKEPFFQRSVVLEAAKVLGISYIEGTVTKQLDDILTKQVWIDDIKAMYHHCGPGNIKRDS